MTIHDLYQHACSHFGITPLKGFDESIEDTQSRTLHCRGKGCLRPQLKDFHLDDEQVKALSKALKDDATISILDLRYNSITDEGCLYIAEMLEVSHPVLS